MRSGLGATPEALAVPRFCTVCGEWFDGESVALHCPRPRPDAVPLPPIPALPGGDFGTVWPIPKRRSAPRPEPRPDYVYGDDLPSAPGYYVYRLWAAVEHCLYVGYVGDNGPRRLSARLGEHRRLKEWWPRVTQIDAADCGGHGEVMCEEIRQIEQLRPTYNILIGRLRPAAEVERQVIR